MQTKTQKLNKANKPELRFPGFSGSWEEKKLGDICNFLKGKGISKNDIVKDGKNKCIRYGELYTIYNEVIENIRSRTNFNINKALLSKKNDILMPTSDVTPNGLARASALNEKNIILGGDILVIRSNNILNKFFSYRVNSHKKDIMRLVSGVTVYHIYGSDLKTLKISIPSLPEQQKIADFLTKTDEWIENLQSQKKDLEKYKKGMMQKIFSQEIRFKKDNGKDFPEWEEKKLGEVCDYKNGESFENNVVDDGKYNLITLNSIDIKGNLKLKHKKVNKSEWYLKKNDLIMVLSDVAHGNFLGLVDIIPENNKYVLNQRMGLLRKKDNNFNLQFLRKFINYNQRYFKRHGQGSSQQNLSKGDILKFKVVVPQKEEQQKIADFLTNLDNLINLKDKQITRAQDWKKGLMQRLFV